MRYARICPNTNGWMSPSGGDKHTGKGFPADYGFGFDEWLLGMPIIPSGNFKGYKAGFIQGFKGKKEGFITDVSCYWLDGSKPKIAYVAIVIKDCQKLGDQEAFDIGQKYKEAHFFDSMSGHLDKLKLRPPVIADPLDVFNVVFRPEDIKLVPPNTPFKASGVHYGILYY